VGFKNLPWGYYHKKLPWGSNLKNLLCEVQKVTVGTATNKTYRRVNITKSYREVQKVTVGQQPKKITVGFKELPWGSNQKNLP
jgi:hypothetical protein